MKKAWIITLLLILGVGVYFTPKVLTKWDTPHEEKFTLIGDITMAQEQFMALRKVTFPVSKGEDAIGVAVAATDVLKRISVYRKTKVSRLLWEGVAKKVSDKNWLVIFREKGDEAKYACWSTVNASTAEPTPLQCTLRKK